LIRRFAAPSPRKRGEGTREGGATRVPLSEAKGPGEGLLAARYGEHRHVVAGRDLADVFVDTRVDLGQKPGGVRAVERLEHVRDLRQAELHFLRVLRFGDTVRKQD